MNDVKVRCLVGAGGASSAASASVPPSFYACFLGLSCLTSWTTLHGVGQTGARWQQGDGASSDEKSPTAFAILALMTSVCES